MILFKKFNVIKRNVTDGQMSDCNYICEEDMQKKNSTKNFQNLLLLDGSLSADTCTTVSCASNRTKSVQVKSIENFTAY
jgi:hypothetical protein